MKKKYLIDVIFILIELALVLTNLFTEFFLKLFANDPFRAFLNVFSAQFIILIIYFAMRFLHHRSEVADFFKDLNDTVLKIYSSVNSCISCRSEISCLGQEEFYSKFRQDAATAKYFVAMTHLDTHPPEHLVGTAEESYYNSLSKLITSKPNVLFQRVERVSVEKKEWLESLVKNHSSSKNFSLYCLISEDTSPLLPAISVQLVDGEKVYLVAVSRHTSPHGGPRDIYLRDKNAHDMWQSYYENVLTKRSKGVIVKGRLDRKIWDEVKQSMEGI